MLDMELRMSAGILANRRLAHSAAHSTLAVALAVTTACFDPKYNHPLCGPHGECPSGMTCGMQNVCGGVGTVGTGGTGSSGSGGMGTSGSGSTGPDAGLATDANGLPECTAQRVVQLVGGNGGLAWFALIWPFPFLITNFDPRFSYDDPNNVKSVTSDPVHPLFVRRIGTRATWEGLGQDSYPSVLLAGSNEAHTYQPQSISLSGSEGLVAAAAAIQTGLKPLVPVLEFAPGGPYGTAPGAPPVNNVNDVNDAISLFHGIITSDIEQQLHPSTTQLANYVPSGSNPYEATLGTQLAFAANAFRLGLTGSVILEALSNDPHGAFDTGEATSSANRVAEILDAFYQDLAASNETACSHNGNPLSLADNVVLIVTGDTFKDPLNHAAWKDSTPGNANLIYVRSNGFLKTGWFGQIDSTGAAMSFDPATGQLVNPPFGPATSAAFAGVLYAVARGNKIMVRPYTAAQFDGVILR